MFDLLSPAIGGGGRVSAILEGVEAKDTRPLIMCAAVRKDVNRNAATLHLHYVDHLLPYALHKAIIA